MNTARLEKKEREQRQKVKKANKKGQAEASRKKADEAARAQQQRAQMLRSATFAAARAGDASNVKKGVWEDNVDAAGGEIKKGCDSFITTAPADLNETLMHIAVKNGDADLIQWLDAHSTSNRSLQEMFWIDLHTLFRCRTRGTQLSRTDRISSCRTAGSY